MPNRRIVCGRIVPVPGQTGCSRSALVVVEYAAEPRTPTNPADGAGRCRAIDQCSLSPDDCAPGCSARRTPRLCGATDLPRTGSSDRDTPLLIERTNRSA